LTAVENSGLLQSPQAPSRRTRCPGHHVACQEGTDLSIIRKIKIRIAAHVLLILFSAVTVFQLMVLVGVIPYHIVWGGRLESRSQMLVFETISIVINLFIISVICMKTGYFRPVLPQGFITVLLWVFVVLFAANTVGNIFSTSPVETMIFTPITFLSVFLFYRLAIEKPSRKS
jgi:hypothetical protein